MSLPRWCCAWGGTACRSLSAYGGLREHVIEEGRAIVYFGVAAVRGSALSQPVGHRTETAVGLGLLARLEFGELLSDAGHERVRQVGHAGLKASDEFLGVGGELGTAPLPAAHMGDKQLTAK
jgi:hypothetical protein